MHNLSLTGITLGISAEIKGNCMRFMFWTICVLFLSFQALKAGSVWDSHAYPMQGATVGIKNSESIKGTMSKKWDGGVEVLTKKGLSVQIPKHSITAISYTIVESDRINWRFWLPSLLIMLSYITFIWRSLKKDFEGEIYSK